MRTRPPEDAPGGLKDMSSPTGRKIRSDKKGEFVCHTPQGRTHAETPRGATTRTTDERRARLRFKRLLETQPWRTHQSTSIAVKQGLYCMYEHCLGATSAPRVGRVDKKRQRMGYRTKHRYEECTVMSGRPLWLCNSTKMKTMQQTDTVDKYQSLTCHMKYHIKNHQTASTTVTPESSPESSPAASPAGESML